MRGGGKRDETKPLGPKTVLFLVLILFPLSGINELFGGGRSKTQCHKCKFNDMGPYRSIHNGCTDCKKTEKSEVNKITTESLSI